MPILCFFALPGTASPPWHFNSGNSNSRHHDYYFSQFMLGVRFSFKAYAKNVREKATMSPLKATMVLLDVGGYKLTQVWYLSRHSSSELFSASHKLLISWFSAKKRFAGCPLWNPTCHTKHDFCPGLEIYALACAASSNLSNSLLFISNIWMEDTKTGWIQNLKIMPNYSCNI